MSNAILRLQIRLPVLLYRRLLRLAEIEHRSLNAQMLWMMTKALAEDEERILRELRLDELPPLPPE